mgnify:CR=1 FL=1
MDNSIVVVAPVLYRMLDGQQPSADERVIVESYFQRFTRVTGDTAKNAHFEQWMKQYRQSGLMGVLLDEWASVFEASKQRLDEAQAEGFVRAFIRDADQVRRVSKGAGGGVICGETVTEKNNLLDYVSQHRAGGEQWLLHLTTEGQCLISGDQPLLISPGQLVLLPPGYSGDYERAPSCTRWVHRWVRFSITPDWLAWCIALRAPDQLKVYSLTDLQFRAANNAFEDLLGLQSANSDRANRMQLNRIEHLLLLSDDSDNEPPPILDSRVQLAMTYTLAHLAEDYSIETLAQECHLSTARFSALFKQQLGVSPMLWRDQLRVREARQRLLNSTDSVAGISMAVGYSDQLHFSRRFKQLVGLSPRQYRQSMGV